MKKIVTCPQCGFRFDISYGRAFACSGCRYSVLGNCSYVKCPKCGHEFPEPGAKSSQSTSFDLS